MQMLSICIRDCVDKQTTSDLSSWFWHAWYLPGKHVRALTMYELDIVMLDIDCTLFISTGHVIRKYDILPDTVSDIRDARLGI